MRCGADTGGTFTDVVADDGRVAKVLSTPGDPSRGVSDGVERLAGGAADGDRPELLAHGTTVATNALLERRGGRVALVTSAGFADVIEIARQDRPSLYDITVDRPVPLVPRELRLEVGGRLDATGREIEALDTAAVPEIPPGVDAVAVCLLHSDLDSVHEQAVASVLAGRGVGDITCSSSVAPEFREYERTVTTVVNAYLRPRCRRYLRSLTELAGPVHGMPVQVWCAGSLVRAITELPIGPLGGR